MYWLEVWKEGLDDVINLANYFKSHSQVSPIIQAKTTYETFHKLKQPGISEMDINIRLCGSTGKESGCSVGDLSSIPGLGRSPGEGKGYPLQYSSLENFMDCIVHGGPKESNTTERFSLSLFIKKKWHQENFCKAGDRKGSRSVMSDSLRPRGL